MNDRPDTRFPPRDRWIPARPKQVLAVPGFDAHVLPDAPTDGIFTPKPTSIELMLPIGRPLAINMTLAGLPRASGTEQCIVSVFGYRRDQLGGRRFRQMLRHFQTEHDLEAAP